MLKIRPRPLPFIYILMLYSSHGSTLYRPKSEALTSSIKPKIKRNMVHKEDRKQVYKVGIHLTPAEWQRTSVGCDGVRPVSPKGSYKHTAAFETSKLHWRKDTGPWTNASRQTRLVCLTPLLQLQRLYWGERKWCHVLRKRYDWGIKWVVVCVRFYILTASNMNMAVFCGVVPCSLIERLVRAYCLHQGCGLMPLKFPPRRFWYF